INEDLSEQLAIIFKKLELPINFDLYFNDSPQSTKLIDYMTTITQLNHKLVLNFHESTEKDLPKFSFNNSSITWHGIPAGHELTPLIIAIHALSTQKIELDAKIIERIKKIKSTIHAMVGVTLNCTFCPNVVQNLMLISIVNPNIKIDIYDIHLFEEFKNQYRIMSVPALIINQSNVVFGNKKIDDIVNLIEKNDS
ncbi:MAG: thioredoxin family protein, partial [Beduini sp.]